MRLARAIGIAALVAAVGAPAAQAQFLPDGMAPMPASRRPALLATFGATGATAAGAYSSITPQAGPAITCARTTTANYIGSDSLMHSASANTCRVDQFFGWLAEPSNSEIVTAPGNLSNGAWAKNSASDVVTANQGVFIDGTTTMALVDTTAGVASDNVFQALTVTSSTGPFVNSMYVRPFASGDVESVGFACGTGNVASCTCYRQSGATCTPYSSGNACEPHGTFTDIDRMFVVVTCSSATTLIYISAHPGQYPFTNGKGYFSGAQSEPLFATSYYAGNRGVDTGPISTPNNVWNANGGDLSIDLIPEWSASTNVGTREIAYGGQNVALTYEGSTSTWKFSAASTSVSSATQSFAAQSEHVVRAQYANGGNVCLTVDGVKTCATAGTRVAPAGQIFIGGDENNLGVSATGAGIGVKSIRINRPPPALGIDALGDSITYGLGLSTPWATVLAQSISPSYSVTNDGIPDNTTAMMLARYQSGAEKTSQYAVVVMGGVNDCGTQFNLSASTAEGNLQAVYDDVLGKGEKLVALKITPFESSGIYSAGGQTCIDTVNAWISTYLSGKTGATVVDLYSLMGDAGGGDAKLLNPTYDSGDHIHPNQTGADFIEAQVKTALGL